MVILIFITWWSCDLLFKMAAIEKKSAERPETLDICGRDDKAHRVIFRYLPYVGAGSYVAFSSYVMQPRIFRSLFGSWDLVTSNVLWFNAQLGIGLYTFNRPHLAKVPSADRIIYSIYTTIMFNFGSTLLWALTRNKIGQSDILRIAFGVLSGLGCLYIGRDYLRAIDQVTDKSNR